MNHEPWAQDREKLAWLQNTRRVEAAPRAGQVLRASISVGPAEDGGPGTYRRTLSYVLLVAFVFLLLVGVMLSDQRVAAAQSPAVVTPSLALQQGMLGGTGGNNPKERPPEEGGSLTPADWQGHFWIAVLSVVIVVVADAATVAWIVRNRRASQ